jgi:peptide/nickel transport system permease protein
MTRANMLEVMREDYIITARAKGLREQIVVFRHAFKNTLIPVVTIIGIQFSYNLGGMMVTETVFARKGVGMLTIQGILEHDVPMVQGTVLFVALIFVVMNLIVDISYAALDPRVRTSEE